MQLWLSILQLIFAVSFIFEVNAWSCGGRGGSLNMKLIDSMNVRKFSKITANTVAAVSFGILGSNINVAGESNSSEYM